MKAVMANVPEHILAWRRRTGADQWDEMWEGVLHMAPSPNRDHQDFEGALEFWLRLHWAEPGVIAYITKLIFPDRALGRALLAFRIWYC